MTIPDRSYRQRLEALTRANAVRGYRAELKRDLKAGRVHLADIIGTRDTDVDERVATMRVYDLLLAAPKVGRTKALRALRHAGVSPSKTVGGLTIRQRRDLTHALPLARATALAAVARAGRFARDHATTHAS